jgi:hypothetical protein
MLFSGLTVTAASPENRTKKPFCTLPSRMITSPMAQGLRYGQVIGIKAGKKGDTPDQSAPLTSFHHGLTISSDLMQSQQIKAQICPWPVA